jgi:3-oxoacyl-[acyl-carrier protein] reductase
MIGVIRILETSVQTDLLSLKGRVALITGAGQGVGRQVALHFAAHGCDCVLVNDFHEARARAVVQELEAMGSKAIPIVGDVTDFEAVSRWVPEAVGKAGGLDIVVNNAGNAGPQGDPSKQPRFCDTLPTDWAAWLNTNLHGVLNVCRVAAPVIAQRGTGGSIINVISDAGRIGEPGLAVYAAAKGGVAAFSRALAKELGRQRIRVNCVSLSAIKTDTVAPLLADPEVFKRIVRQYPIGRIGEPTDAANMILFLASDAANWITAQTYPVNGGYSISQ